MSILKGIWGEGEAEEEGLCRFGEKGTRKRKLG